MLVRTLSGLAWIAASAGAAFAQPASPVLPGTTVPIPLAPPQKLAPPQMLPPPQMLLPKPPEMPVRFVDSMLPPIPTMPITPVSAHPMFHGKMPVYDHDEAIGPSYEYWARNEWLYWATSGQPLPALVTASPVGTAPALAGVPGSPNTAVMYGNGRVNNDFRNGYRLNIGAWFDDCRMVGIESDFFFLGDSRQGFSAGSPGATIIARPTVNPTTGLADVSFISFPATTAGAVAVDVRNSTIGGGFNTLHDIAGTNCCRFDLLVGYRYWNVSDDVRITDSRIVAGGPPQSATFRDHFDTSNSFNGGMIGLSTEKQGKKWFVAARASVALGASWQTLDIRGTTVTAPFGGPIAATQGGVLAQPSNIGDYSRTVFAVVPEIGVRVGCQICEYARFYTAYNFLYISNVLRAGDQIGTALPTYTPNPTDFWAQGISLGVELRY